MLSNSEILGIRIVRWLNFNEVRHNRCLINYSYAENILLSISLKVKEASIFSMELASQFHCIKSYLCHHKLYVEILNTTHSNCNKDKRIYIISEIV